MSVQLKRSNGAWEFLAGGLSSSSSSGYDGGLSIVSENAVQNKVITNAVNDIRAGIGDIQQDISSINAALSDIDTTPTANSTKLVQSGGVYSSITSVDDKLKSTITTTDQALPESEIQALISEVDALHPVGVTSDPDTLTLDRDHAVYTYTSDDSATALSNFPDNSLRGYTILVLSGNQSVPTLIAFNNGKAWLRISTNPTVWDEIVTARELAEFVHTINQSTLTGIVGDSTPFVTGVVKDNADPHTVDVTSTTAGDLNTYIESKYDTEATEDSTHAVTSGEIYNIKEDLQSQIDALEGARIYKGSSSTIPDISTVQVGWVYNITDAFTTTNDFVEGAGIEVTAGSDIACVNTGTADTPILKWDILADTSLFQRKQLTTALQIGTTPKVTTVEEALTKVSNIVPIIAGSSGYASRLTVNGTVIELSTIDYTGDVNDAWDDSSTIGSDDRLRLFGVGTTNPSGAAGIVSDYHYDDETGAQMMINTSDAKQPNIYLRHFDFGDSSLRTPWTRMALQQDFTFTKAANSTSVWAVFKFSNQHVVNFNLPLIMTVGGNGYFATYIINRFRAYAFKDRSNWLSKIMVSEATVTPGYIAFEITGTAAYSGRVEFTHIGQIPDTLTFVGMKTQAEMLSLMNASSVDNILESVDGTFSWPTTTNVGVNYSETVDVKGTEGLLAIAGWNTSGNSYRNLYYLSYEPRQNTPVIRLIASGLGEQTGNPITAISATRSGTAVTLNITVTSTNNIGTYIKLTPMNE